MADSSVQGIGQELAREALEIEKELQKITEQLEAKKQDLRDFANGKKLRITVEGVGLVDITEPRKASEKVVLVLDDKKLQEAPELRAKLLQKGVAKETVQKTPAMKASVRLKLNV